MQEQETESPVLCSRSGRVATLTLNRPRQLNALNDALMDALGAALLAADADADIGAIIITGSERAFAAGADIAAMRGWSYADVFASDYVTRNWETIRRVRKPVIAAVAGHALGGGCELALACDLIIAADSARFGLPELRLGVIPGAGGTQRLPRAIGKARAMDLCLSARTIDAAEAERIGLISRLVPAERLQTEAAAVAASIAAQPPLATIALKEAINRAYESPLSEGLLFERRTMHALFATADLQEGMNAFLDRREARFRGR